jgi:hypothetical protein
MAPINLGQEEQGVDRIMDLLTVLLKNKKDEESQVRREAHDVKMFNMQREAWDKRDFREQWFKLEGLKDSGEHNKAYGIIKYAKLLVKQNPNNYLDFDIDKAEKEIDADKVDYDLDKNSIDSFFDEPSIPTDAERNEGLEDQMDILNYRFAKISDRENIHPALIARLDKEWLDPKMKLPKFLPFATDVANYDAETIRGLFSGKTSIGEYSTHKDYSGNYSNQYEKTYEILRQKNVEDDTDYTPEQLRDQTIDILSESMLLPIQNESIARRHEIGADYAAGFEKSKSNTVKNKLEEIAQVEAEIELANTKGLTLATYRKTAGYLDEMEQKVKELFGGPESAYDKWSSDRDTLSENAIKAIDRAEKIKDVEVAEEALEEASDFRKLFGAPKLTKALESAREEANLQGENIPPLGAEAVETAIDIVNEIPVVSDEIDKIAGIGSIKTDRDQQMYQWLVTGNKEQKKKAHQYFRVKTSFKREKQFIFAPNVARRLKTKPARDAYSRIVSGSLSPLQSYKEALKGGNKKEIDFKLVILNKRIDKFNEDHGFKITLSQILND